MTYDAAGKVLSSTSFGGVTTTYAYDANGLTSKTTGSIVIVLSSTSFGGITTTYAYDANGRLTSKTTGSTVISFTYTQDGRLLTMTDEQGVTEYAYDTMNGLARVSYPDGTYVEYTYDSSNRLISLQTPFGETRYTYDALHRLATVTDKDGAETRYTYDANGNRSSMTYANGVTTLYTYDSCNRLISQTIKDTNGTILENYEITLGAAGERLQIVEKNRTVNYTYDNLYRLTRETISANGVSNSTTYTYDAMSNRLSKETTSGTTTYTYNELNQLTASSDATYTYDADGNQIAVQEAARSVTYHYNDLGRMSGAVVQSLGQTTLETYSYNGNGIRIAKSTDGTETRYLIDPNGALSYVLAEYNADGNLSAYYTRGTELISRETSGKIRYYQYDPNGSVRLLTDASGDVSDTYTYDAFGSLIFQTGNSGNSFLFQGEQYDAATGLYYLRARYMNPTTGTFTTMDAYQGSTSDPMSLHKYLFANANPVMNSDPSGYMAEMVEGKLETQLGKINCIMILADALSNSAPTIATGFALMKMMVVMSALFAPVGLLIAIFVIDPCLAGYSGTLSEEIAHIIQDLTLDYTIPRSFTDAFVMSLANTAERERDYGEYTVYCLKDSDENVVYVGRTKNYAATKIRHGNNPYRADLTPHELEKNLSDIAARGLEQAYIVLYETLKPDKEVPRQNQIRGVSKNNSKYWKYYLAAIPYLSPENTITLINGY